MKVTLDIDDQLVEEAAAAADRINGRRAEAERLPPPVRITQRELRDAVYAYLKAFILQDVQQVGQRAMERAWNDKAAEMDARISGRAAVDTPAGEGIE